MLNVKQRWPLLQKSKNKKRNTKSWKNGLQNNYAQIISANLTRKGPSVLKGYFVGLKIRRKIPQKDIFRRSVNPNTNGGIFKHFIFQGLKYVSFRELLEIVISFKRPCFWQTISLCQNVNRSFHCSMEKNQNNQIMRNSKPGQYSNY